jgi:hypothetical protein
MRSHWHDIPVPAVDGQTTAYVILNEKASNYKDRPRDAGLQHFG